MRNCTSINSVTYFLDNSLRHPELVSGLHQLINVDHPRLPFQLPNLEQSTEPFVHFRV